MANELIRFWKGSENAYRELFIRGRIKEDVRYSVICNDGTIKEYLGKTPIDNCDLEQIAMLDDAVSIDTFQENYKKGLYKNCRLLVGDNNAFDSNGKLLDEYTPSVSENTLWYVFVFSDDAVSPTMTIDFTNKSARIKSYTSKEYQVIDGVLTSYNHIVWHDSK